LFCKTDGNLGDIQYPASDRSSKEGDHCTNF